MGGWCPSFRWDSNARAAFANFKGGSATGALSANGHPGRARLGRPPRGVPRATCADRRACHQRGRGHGLMTCLDTSPCAACATHRGTKTNHASMRCHDGLTYGGRMARFHAIAGMPFSRCRGFHEEVTFIDGAVGEGKRFMLDEYAKGILSWVPPNPLSEGRRCVMHVQSVAVSYAYNSLADPVDTRIGCPHLNCTTE